MTKKGMDVDLSFVPQYASLQEIVADAHLAAFGDAYVNFIYSIAQSQKKKKLVGKKVSNQVLACALRRAGMRSCLPKRSDRHSQANAVEAFIAYGWLQGVITISECVSLLRHEKDDVKGFVVLLDTIRKRFNL